MQQLKLMASARGDESSSRLRGDGRIPGIVYGHSDKALPIALDAKEFTRVLGSAGHTHLVELMIDGSKASTVLIREVQHHPRRLGPIHVDFYRVSMKEKLHADVPLVAVGESPAIKAGHGELLQVLHTVKVECLPGDIPQALEVDLGRLVNSDDVIRLGDVAAPKGVAILGDPEETVAKVAVHRVAAEEPEAEAAAPTEPTLVGEEQPAAE